MKQTWQDILFAHYPIEQKLLRPLVPDTLQLDLYNGLGWIGVVSLYVKNNRLRGLPKVPGIDQFPQLNVRTYVTLNGKPGVYFLSIDAPNILAVMLAKTFYRLPFYNADILIRYAHSEVHFKSIRRKSDIQYNCSYYAASEFFLPKTGSFDEWIAERYSLYSLGKSGQIFRCDILHEPWSLKHAEAEFGNNTLLSNQGIRIESQQPILHFAKKKDVRLWPVISVR